MTQAKTKPRDPDLLSGVAPKTAEAPARAKVTIAKPAPKSNAIAIIEPPPTNMLAVIARAASNPSVDVPKMKELLALQREIEQAQEAREFNRALLAAQKAMPHIVKDRENTHTKSRYPTLENVSTKIDSIAREHGFTMSFGTADSPLEKHYRIICDLSHDGGHTRRYHVDLQADTVGPSGTRNKTEVQGVGSTMSYGRRYLKIMMFDLTIVGEDTDGNKRKTAARDEAKSEAKPDPDAKINGTQAKELLKAIDDCGVEATMFMEKYHVNAVHELPLAMFDEAIKSCRNYAARTAEATARKQSK